MSDVNVQVLSRGSFGPYRSGSRSYARTIDGEIWFMTASSAHFMCSFLNNPNHVEPNTRYLPEPSEHSGYSKIIRIIATKKLTSNITHPQQIA